MKSSTAQPESTVFIAYRRVDSAHVTGRMYDRLVDRFGKARVVKDVHSIPAGVTFADYIAESIGHSAVELVIIGPRWLTTSTDDARRRLDDPDDFVRIEIEAALRQGVPVIPVLVDGAMMPRAHDLPASLKGLVERNAAQVRSDPDFHRDMERLIVGVEYWMARPRPVPTASAPDAAPAPVAPGEARIFISHDRADNAFGIRLAEDLRRALGDPTAVWYDTSSGSHGGNAWWQTIASEVTSRNIFLVIWSPDARDSAWVNDEIDVAWEQRNKTIIPLLYGRPCELRQDLRLRHAISFLPPKDYEAGLAELLSTLGLTPDASTQDISSTAPPSPAAAAASGLPPSAPTPTTPSVAAPAAAGVSIFISYSRKDDTVVSRLVNDLQAEGITVWIDKGRLTPGTPDWEREIRRAIGAAQGVIYVASEDAVASQYVRDEITIAHDKGIPVFPIWVRGDRWSDCVPLGWGRTQYVDGRGSEYDSAIQALIASLTRVTGD